MAFGINESIGNYIRVSTQLGLNLSWAGALQGVKKKSTAGGSCHSGALDLLEGWIKGGLLFFALHLNLLALLVGDHALLDKSIQDFTLTLFNPIPISLLQIRFGKHFDTIHT